MSFPRVHVVHGVPRDYFDDLALDTLLFARQPRGEDVNVPKRCSPDHAVAGAHCSLSSVADQERLASANTSELRVRWGTGSGALARPNCLACRAATSSPCEVRPEQAETVSSLNPDAKFHSGP